MKRLSSLAQLVALYAEAKGITSTFELARRTGRTPRQIWRAKAELTTTVKNVTDTNVTDINVSPPPPKRKVSPCTPSKENTPPPPASSSLRSSEGARQARQYAFEGRVIKLNQADFDRWKRIYRGIPDLAAALTAADDWFAENPRKDGQWFARASAWLARENATARAGPAAKLPAWREEEKRRHDAMQAALSVQVEPYRGRAHALAQLVREGKLNG